MAYITKEEVKAKNEKLKVLNKQYGVKARFSGSNSSTLLLKVTEGCIDFVANHIDCMTNHPRFDADYAIQVAQQQYLQANHYYLPKNFCGVALEYLEKAYAIMLEGHFDDSDTMTDYFHCSWYNNIHIGAWDKPYKLV